MSEDKVVFISNLPHLIDIEECRPKPVSKFVPDWWKSTQIDKTVFQPDMIDFGNVKNCPSFSDYFSQGYCIPMWEDTVISFNRQTQDWFWKVPNKSSWEYHTSDQFVDIAQPAVRNKNGYAVFKAISPWEVVTPPGYSVLALPMFYHFNKDFTVLPGIIHSDVRHRLNIQVLLHSDKEQIFIDRGTPLVQYIPFKRSDVLPMEYRTATKEDLNMLDASDLRYATTFSPVREYIKQRKESDKKLVESNED